MLLNLVYLVAILLASPVLASRAIRQGKYRRGWQAKLRGRVELPEPTRPRVWFHAVSVGEVNLLGGLVARLRERRPDLEIVVSTTTATGYELALKRFPPEHVFYCPLDFSWAVERSLRTVRPDALVLAELEVWPNLIRQAKRHGIPVAVINGRLSETSFRGYQRLRPLIAPTFARLSLVAAQNETYADRFARLGTDPAAIAVTGSTKFDDAPLSRETEAIRSFRRLVAAAPEQPIFVAGSTQAGEEAVALEAYAALLERSPELRMILVPRHAERFDEVAAEIQRHGFLCRRRSELAAPAREWDPRTVVLVDSIGELRSWWGLATVAFVGGSLGSRGGQNMLEPAGYGAAVCFGPNTRNFRDIVEELLAARAAEVVTDRDALVEFVARMLATPEQAERMGAAAREVIERHQGATNRTLEHLEKILPAAN
ncbi:3-deoxy-D-manno-octulosonic acid transferase [Candidatus Laterigemmans baculatus]|uniref:3-deoxy-D-manno-octulosonic acid transferase n=1 Tax=Candidatus Laterigemmans baculatus TaxID=2770505 RepID=UPI0013DC8492|nr:3-deoxy-D-manno-octulosonic acid transferase [Candidatus Laterigemmans baculatus]